MYEVPAVPEREKSKSAMHIFLCLTACLRGSYFYIKYMCLCYFKICKMPLFGGLGFVWVFCVCFRVFSNIVKIFVYCIPAFLLLTKLNRGIVHVCFIIADINDMVNH